MHSWQGEFLDELSLKASSGVLSMDCGSYLLADGSTGGVMNADCVNQDDLVTRVAAKNPNTIVVIETGGAVLMPWLNGVKGVLKVWYPGASGGKTIANLLFGMVNPSGKLPITFPLSENDLPRPVSPVFQTPTVGPLSTLPCTLYCGTTSPPGTNFPNDFFNVNYNIESQSVGYKWFDSQNKPVLFPFGHGLSYTTFAYSKIVTTPVVTDGTKPIRVSFFLTNTGKVAGAEVAQVYLGLPAVAGEAPKRFVGSQKVFLKPGEKQRITVTIDPLDASHPLSYWDGTWKTPDGEYKIYVGTSSRKILLDGEIKIHHGS